MSVSKFINENEGYLRESINSGINAEAVKSTVSDIVDATERKGKVPKQFGKTLSALVLFKHGREDKVDFNYVSRFVSNNSERIKSALTRGITPIEIATTLNDLTNKNSKKQLKFMVKLISKMKQKELVLSRQKQEEKSYQKVLINNTNGYN